MKKISKIISMFAFLMVLMIPVSAYAANASVLFGSEEYSINEAEEFPIGLYIRSTEEIQNFNVKVKYDNLRLKYVSGATSEDEGDGILSFVGDGNGTNQVKFWLIFEPVGSGEASVEVTEAIVNSMNDEACTIITLDKAPVYIANGIVDEVVEKDNKSENIVEQQNTEATELADSEKSTEPNRLQKFDEEPVSKASGTENKDNGLIRFVVAVITIIVLAILGIVISMVIHDYRHRRKRKHKKKSGVHNLEKKQRERLKTNVGLVENKNVNKESVNKEKKEAKVAHTDLAVKKKVDDTQKPVISVNNVSMRFRISTSNTSGIKDFIIQKLKRQVDFRELLALNDVSFDVFKGEVVGIIGTNGSGKSTILKIISGALRPTTGYVDVDKTKIQLLTLGTGFDHELTARENVYLNGAIIGYSKEFLDEHFDEIVEFAELEGFMDEKVKNFSSGMVSRLGFAIATVGDAAEILILDEVLSVGDEFFRKKSLKRVKEMIHGGSTVIMVSHSMATIKENCSKVVWIEKGKLQMVGTPDEVCPEYRKLGIDG